MILSSSGLLASITSMKYDSRNNCKMTASFDNFSAFVEDDTNDPEYSNKKRHFQFH